MTPRPRRRGRPRRQGVMIVNMRIPLVVYDAYCARAAKEGPDVSVRTIMQRTLLASVRHDDLDARQARLMAVSLLVSAENMDREGDRRHVQTGISVAQK